MIGIGNSWNGGVILGSVYLYGTFNKFLILVLINVNNSDGNNGLYLNAYVVKNQYSIIPIIINKIRFSIKICKILTSSG